MKKPKYYPEEHLIRMYHDGKIDMLYLVKHHSKRWKQQYAQFCEDNDLPQDNTSAEVFYERKADELEQATNHFPQ